jgi:ABC-type multidrug transport system ATPase subunit
MKVVANNLGKRFNREWVFKNFNYEFNSGNSYAITGPNGSGKSTLMQVLWGQMQQSAGAITYSEIDPSDIYKQVAIAAPYMDLIDEFTLEEMVHFHFKFKTRTESIESIVEKIELPSARTKIISSFSSGMRQRLKLALAFYSKVDLLFLDEPCSNLDKKSIEWYQHQLKQVANSTVVFIASNQEHEYPFTSNKIDILAYK